MNVIPLILTVLSASPAPGAQPAGGVLAPAPVSSTVVPQPGPASRARDLKLEPVLPSAAVRGPAEERRVLHARVLAARLDLERVDDRLSRARNDAQRRDLVRRRLLEQRRIESLTFRLLSRRVPKREEAKADPR